MKDSEVQILLITVGGGQYGVDLEHVRHVAPMSHDFMYRGTDSAEHIVLNGSPHRYVPLWDKLLHHSAFKEYEELVAMLPQRRRDHVGWMAALEDSVRNGVPFAKARDAHGCAFGKWFYAFRPRELRLEIQLKQFETPHARIHALADHLLDQVATGKREAALHELDQAENTTLAELLALFDETEILLTALQRRVAILVDDGNHGCVLGADGINDIVAVPSHQVRHNAVDHGISARAVSALIVLDDSRVIPLLDWRSLRTARLG